MPRWTTCAGAYIREDLKSAGTTSPTNVTKLVAYEQGLITLLIADGYDSGKQEVGDTKAMVNAAGLTALGVATGYLGGACAQPAATTQPDYGFVGILGEVMTDIEFAKLYHFGYVPEALVLGTTSTGTASMEALMAVNAADSLAEAAEGTDRLVGILLGTAVTADAETLKEVWLF